MQRSLLRHASGVSLPSTQANRQARTHRARTHHRARAHMRRTCVQQARSRIRCTQPCQQAAPTLLSGDRRRSSDKLHVGNMHDSAYAHIPHTPTWISTWCNSPRRTRYSVTKQSPDLSATQRSWMAHLQDRPVARQQQTTKDATSFGTRCLQRHQAEPPTRQRQPPRSATSLLPCLRGTCSRCVLDRRSHCQRSRKTPLRHSPSRFTPE